MLQLFSSLQRFYCLLLVFYILCTLAASAPAVVPEDTNPHDTAIAPVADTGSYKEVFESAEDQRNQTPVPVRIPSKEETGHQIDAYKIQPLSFAHTIEGTLRLVGLEKQTNVILDSLCLLAYTYLLRLTSKSRLYIMEVIQLFGFFCFPALPVVQLFNNTLRFTRRSLYQGTSGLRHSLACLIGQYAIFLPVPAPLSLDDKSAQPAQQTSRSSLARLRLAHVMPHELELLHGPAMSPVRRIGGLFVALVTVAASITNLHIHLDHPVRSDWDSVGIASDQRHGWLASSAILASCLSVIAILVNSGWSVKPEFMRPDLACGILGESEIFMELAVAAVLQDLFAGLSGADSFAGYFFELAVSRWGLLALLVFVAVANKRLVCIAKSLTSSRARGRRNSGVAVSKPAISIVALVICILIGGYHMGGQVMMMRLAASRRKAAGGGLSAGMSSAK